MAVALVGAPQDRAPVGVSAIVLHFRNPPDPMALARALERDVTLVDPQPRTLAGQPVLSHHGDGPLPGGPGSGSSDDQKWADLAGSRTFSGLPGSGPPYDQKRADLAAWVGTPSVGSSTG